MALIGYARVSTQDQNLDLQRDALQAAGVERAFEESASGADRDRPELGAALDYMRAGDTLVVWRLDRLGRSLSHLLSVVEGLTERGIHLRSLTESIDTTTATGRMTLSIFGALAEFERELIRERTHAGLAAARARGRMGERHLPERVGAVVEEYLQVREIGPEDRLLKSLGKVSAPSISYTHFVKHLARATASLSLPRLTMQDLRAAGEAEVARRLGRPAAAAWARHSLQVQMGHYVAVEHERTSLDAAGWDDSE